jgi:hypothetical protein
LVLDRCVEHRLILPSRDPATAVRVNGTMTSQAKSS